MKVATWVALSMSVAAWLVSYVPGHRRLEQPQQEPQDVDVEAERPNRAPKRMRRRLRLPCETWLSELCQEHNCSLNAEAVLDDRPRPRYVLQGLALLRPGKLYENIFTAFNKEERLLWHYFCCPLDGFTFQIQDFRACERREIWNAVRHRNSCTRNAKHGDIRASDAYFWTSLDLGDTLVSRGRDGGTADQVIAEWGIPDYMMRARLGGRRRANSLQPGFDELPCISFKPSQLCVLLAEPLAELVLAGQWKTVMMLGRFHRKAASFLRGWPGTAWLAANSGKHLASGDGRHEQPTSRGDVQLFAEALREWLPRIQAGASDDDERDYDEAVLSRLLRFLDGLSLELAPGRSEGIGHFRPGPGQGGLKYHALRILHAMRLMHAARRRLPTQQLIDSMVNIIVPGSLRAAVRSVHVGDISGGGAVNELEAANAVPRGLNQQIPSSFLMSRYQLAMDCAYMLWWRGHLSSEPAAEYFKVDSSPQVGYDLMMSQVARVFHRDLLEVSRAVDRLALDAGRQAMEPGERAADSKTIIEKITLHRQPLQALGIGATTVEHKLSALCQSMLLESSSVEALVRRCQQARAFTTDMGVELALSGYKADSITDLLPRWWHEALQDDAPLEAGDAGDGARGGGGTSQSVFPASLTVAGLQHVLSNAERDMHKSLSHWSYFMGELKVVASFLDSGDRLRRFTATCLTGHFAGFKSLFETRCGKVYEQRWTVVMDVLDKVLALETALRATWCLKKYNAGGQPSRPKPDAADDVEVDTSQFDKIVKSSFFWVYASMCSAGLIGCLAALLVLQFC